MDNVSLPDEVPLYSIIVSDGCKKPLKDLPNRLFALFIFR